MPEDSPDGGEPFVVPVRIDGSEWLVFQPPLNADDFLGVRRTGWAIFRSEHWDASELRTVYLRFGHDRPVPQDAYTTRLVPGIPGGVRSLKRRHPETRALFAVNRELHVSFREGIGPRVLRDLPLARIEAAVNQPGIRWEVLDRSLAYNVRGMQLNPAAPPDVPGWRDARPSTSRRPSLRVRVPEGRGRPDSFYEQVAERFAYLTTVSQRPATDLANANGVPTTTVHGWVKEARRRGILPAGERAKGESS